MFCPAWCIKNTTERETWQRNGREEGRDGFFTEGGKGEGRTTAWSCTQSAESNQRFWQRGQSDFVMMLSVGCSVAVGWHHEKN